MEWPFSRRCIIKDRYLEVLPLCGLPNRLHQHTLPWLVIYYTQKFRECCSGERDTAFCSLWILAILWRWQHTCLYSESMEVFWVNVVNIGAVLQEWWLILWGEFLNFILERFSAHELCITQFQSKFSWRNYAITMLYSFPALFTLLLHHVAAMPFLPFVKCGGRGICLWKIGETSHLNNSKSVFKNFAYAFQRTKNYLLYCPILKLDWILVSENNDKAMSIMHIQTHWATNFFHTDRPFVRLHLGLFENENFK